VAKISKNGRPAAKNRLGAAKSRKSVLKKRRTSPLKDVLLVGLGQVPENDSAVSKAYEWSRR